MTDMELPDTSTSRLQDDAATGSAILRNMRAGAHWFGSDGSIFAKGLRFGFVGAISGLIFAAITAALISGAGFDEKLSSIVGYVVSMPANFFANRSFSFRSQGRIWSDAVRFASLHFVNMAVTAGAMGAAVNVLALHYLFGVAGAILLVPLANFFLMNIWVFGARARRKRTAASAT